MIAGFTTDGAVSVPNVYHIHTVWMLLASIEKIQPGQ